MTIMQSRGVIQTLKRRPTTVLLVCLIVGALAAGAVLFSVGVAQKIAHRNEVAGSRSVPIRPLKAALPASLRSTTATITSDQNRATSLSLELQRPSNDQSVASVRVSFDGSGGGEVRQISCSVTGLIAWTVSPGETQRVRLPCSGYVAPWQKRALAYVLIE